jgi:hypothetical protein
MRKLLSFLLLSLWLAVSPAYAGCMSLMGAGSCGGAPASTTFDPVNLGSTITLSGGNLTATGSGGNSLTRTLASHSSGKYYAEFTVGAATNIGVGVVAAAFGVNDYIGDGSSVGTGYGSAYLGSVSGTTTCDSIQTVGHTYGVAVDVGNRTMWVKDLTAGGNWNANVSANPATNTNGAILGGTVATGAIFLAFTPGFNGDNATFNFGATAYVGTPPSGFGNW